MNKPIGCRAGTMHHQVMIDPVRFFKSAAIQTVEMDACRTGWICLTVISLSQITMAINAQHLFMKIVNFVFFPKAKVT